MLLNILQCTGQTPVTELLVQNVSSAKVGNFCPICCVNIGL